jgi:uncharacterized membrane protein
MNIFFWILFGIDVIVGLIAVYFFFIGLGDRSISERNIMLWMGMLLAIAIILLGSVALKNTDHPVLAKSLLSVLAVPTVLYGLFMFIAVVTKARWN